MSVTTSPDHLLGEIVTWDTGEGEIDIAVIRQALELAGLPCVAKDLNSRSAFTRATKHLKENRSIDKVKQGKDGTITFQLTKKQIAGETMDFQYECRVILDTKTGDIQSESLEVETEARKLYAHAMQVRTASDITRMVQTMFKNNADLFPINPRRGIAYFTPQAHAGFTAKVQMFIEAMGGSLWRFPVPKGTSDGNKSVKEAVASGLRAILDELNECVDGWDDTTRTTTMTRGIKKWQEIKHKAECYAEYLSSEQAELLKQIDAAKAKLVEKVHTVQTEPANA